jgi:hypothetical protein
MSVRIIEGIADGTAKAAVFYDSVTNTAFGPLFEDADEAEAFFQSFRQYHGDPRMYSTAELVDALQRWRELSGSCS